MKFKIGDPVWVHVSNRANLPEGKYAGVITPTIPELDCHYAVEIFGHYSQPGSCEWRCQESRLTPRRDDYDGLKVTTWDKVEKITGWCPKEPVRIKVLRRETH